MSAMKLTVLSIDWDFFIYNGELDDQLPITNPATGEPDTIPGAFLYDWGHSEANSDALQVMQWATRLNSFEMFGLDLTKEATLRLKPSAFVNELRGRWPTAGVLEVADSHSWGALTCMRAANTWRPVHVVHFDAHHDLGYGRAGDVQQWNCGNWLYAAMKNGWVTSAEIVYPDWRGLKEWRDVAKGRGPRQARPWLNGLDIHATTWSRWLKEKDDTLPVGTFLCRSSAWTPPYLDRQFADLLNRLKRWATKYECLDHEDLKIGCYDACKPRRWKPVLEAAEQYRAAAKSMMEVMT